MGLVWGCYVAGLGLLWGPLYNLVWDGFGVGLGLVWGGFMAGISWLDLSKSG